VKPESKLSKPWPSGSGLKPYSVSRSRQLVPEGHDDMNCDSLSYSANLITGRKVQVVTYCVGSCSPGEVVGDGERHCSRL
jgi:hypothetical protein